MVYVSREIIEYKIFVLYNEYFTRILRLSIKIGHPVYDRRQRLTNVLLIIHRQLASLHRDNEDTIEVALQALKPNLYITGVSICIVYTGFIKRNSISYIRTAESLEAPWFRHY